MCSHMILKMRIGFRDRSFNTLERILKELVVEQNTD